MNDETKYPIINDFGYWVRMNGGKPLQKFTEPNWVYIEDIEKRKRAEKALLYLRKNKNG